jgi:hypothetical protein
VSSEELALVITFLIHVVGICVLFGALLLSEGGGWRDWWPRDDDDDGPPDPGPGPAPPLPDADPSPARLREPGRIADAHPGPARRPRHAPGRSPQRERVG